MNIVLVVRNIPINPGSALGKLTWVSVLQLQFPWVQKEVGIFP